MQPGDDFYVAPPKVPTTIEEAVKLLYEYDTWQPAYGESGADQQWHFDNHAVHAAGTMLNRYAMAGGDTSAFPKTAGIQRSITPEYTQFLAKRSAQADPGQTFGDQLFSFMKSPPVLIAAGGLAGMGALGGVGSGTGAATGTGAAGGAAGGTGITTGAAGQTGLTLGTATGGIGGGALGSGLTAGGSTAGLGTAAGAGALGAGYFGSETAYPVSGGQTAAATGAGTGAGTTAAQQTALSKIMSGTGTAQDYMTLFGQVAPALLGMYASDKQADALGDMAARYEAMGAPYRDRLGELYSDPTAFLNSPEVKVPVQMGTDALARSLSTQGNPAGSGHALQELQNYSTNQLFSRLGQEKDRLAGFGGLTQYQAQAPQIGVNAIGAEGNVYNALGYGIGATTQPPRSLADMLKMYNLSQGLA